MTATWQRLKKSTSLPLFWWSHSRICTMLFFSVAFDRCTLSKVFHFRYTLTLSRSRICSDFFTLSVFFFIHSTLMMMHPPSGRLWLTILRWWEENIAIYYIANGENEPIFFIYSVRCQQLMLIFIRCKWLSITTTTKNPLTANWPPPRGCNQNQRAYFRLSSMHNHQEVC